MTTLLQINSSLFAEGGQSSQLANQFVSAWRNGHKDSHVIQRELASEPVPHLTAERFQAFLSKPEERTAEQKAVVAYSDKLHRRAASGRHDCAGPADVQLRLAFHAQGVL